MGNRVWFAAVAAMLLLAGCASNRTIVVNSSNAQMAANVPQNGPQRIQLTAGAIILYRMHALRVSEEAALVKTSGAPKPLPTGQCIAAIPVDATGVIDGALEVNCDNPALVSDLRRAILTAAPYNVPPGLNALHFHLNLRDAEPGAEHG